MKDEIKEILDKFKDYNLTTRESKLLLDYITNLQTIEREYTALLSENAELENKITNLQEQLHQASLDIQELTERDMWCPSNCEKLTNLQEEKDKYFQDSLILAQENERLNNIINELEKFIIEEETDNNKLYKSNITSQSGKYRIEIENCVYDDILDKLKELKGENNV